MQKISVFTVIVFSIISAQSQADSWDSYNDPSGFDSNYEYNFKALPLMSVLESSKRPWSESYWPRNKGSINIRWNTPGKPGFDYRSPSKMDVMGVLSTEQLKQLSPSEKFDLAQGHYDYPLTRHVAQVNAKRDAKDFEGICDGWTATAMQFVEPKPVEIRNPEGIMIPFGSSDVKALMAYHAAFNDHLGSVIIGRYCLGSAGLAVNSSRCSDLNPGAFHVILANEIGLKGKPFAVDVDIRKETWNQPVYGFEFTIVGSAKSSAPKAVQIHSKMMYTDELEDSSWLPVTGTDKFLGAVQESDYVLEMDSNDRIIGGYWISKYIHPDVFWKPTKKVVFAGKFEFINKIYQPYDSNE